MSITILTPTDLNNIRSNLSGDYILGANIDLAGYANWEPIGTVSDPFVGKLDGSIYEVSNLTIVRSTSDNIGLFGVCQFNILVNNPNLKNVKLTGTSVVGKDYVGALAGKIITTQKISPAFDLVVNCSSAGSVNGASNVGGLVGLVDGPDEDVFDEYAPLTGRLSECYSLAAVTGSGSNIGGLVGQTQNIKFYRSHAAGTVDGGNVVGGLVGLLGGNGLTEFCYAIGDVSGARVAGGLVGAAPSRTYNLKSYAEGNVIGTEEYSEPEIWNTSALGIGGLIGYALLEGIDRCYALGNVTGIHRVGGLIGSGQGGGYRSPNIVNSFSQGNVSGTSQIGGLIGYAFPSYLDLKNLYCTGSVTGSKKGAIIGYRGAPYFPEDPIGTITYHTPAFFNSDVNTASINNGGEGKTAAELGLESTFEDDWTSWDYYWVIDVDESDYPILKDFYDPVGIVISAIRGWIDPDDSNNDQGLVVAYVNDGAVYYRALVGGTWAVAVQVTELSTPANTVSLFRTNDGRIGFIADVNGRLYWAITEPYGMTIAHTKDLTINGNYPNVLQLTDGTVKLYYTSPVGMVVEVGANFDGDWDAVQFGLVRPYASDSNVSRLKVKNFDKLYLLWRSRGQHRLAQREDVEEVSESFFVPSGSITLQAGTPVVSVSLELDDSDVLGGGA